MTRIAKSIFLTAALCVMPYVAYACMCPPPPPAKEAARRSDRVFVGKVTSIRTHKSAPVAVWFYDRVADIGNVFGADWRRDDSRDFRQGVRLQIIENFKGPPAKEIKMSTGSGMGDCGFPFSAGQTYLVFARYLKERDEFVTSSCDGTDKVSRSERQLADLRAGI